MRRQTSSVFTIIVCLSLLWVLRPVVSGQEELPPSAEGVLPSDALWEIDMPEGWNGDLLLYSHGYGGGPQYDVRAASTEPLRRRLLEDGYALAATGYAQTGWAVESALQDQVAILDEFEQRYRRPDHTIAWGQSMGGLVTLGLVQNQPTRFDGGLALCASVGGVVGMLNTSLDGAFVIRTLLAPDEDIPLVRMPDERATNAKVRAILDSAQDDPHGLARIALAAAMAQVALWSRDVPPPADDDYAAQARNQAAAFMFAVMTPRTPLEERAGGNFSWNTGIDYRQQLEASGRLPAVQALYAAAGASLDDDLAALARAPRIAPDAEAVAYMKRNLIPAGRITLPFMTIASPGDNLTSWAHESALREAVEEAGSSALLRQTVVGRGGHCIFSPEEVVAAVRTLAERIDSGTWSDTSPEAMNRRAMDVGRSEPPPFIAATPPPFPRPCTSQGATCLGEP